MSDASDARALRVLYVTSTWDAPGRYRAVHAVRQLRAAGVAANVRHVDDRHLERDLAGYSLIVVFRVPWSPALARVVQLARTNGARLVFDVDDLVFEPGAERHLPFFPHLSTAAQREYLALFPRLQRTFETCEAVIASTPVIAARATDLGKPAWVHPNLVAPEYERDGRLVRQLRRRWPPAPAIVFLSGSNTHDPDLAAVGPAIAAALARHPAARLIVGGFVRLPPALRPFADRVERLPYLDWRVYPWVFARSRVSIAPAAVVNDFTNAKSALKFFEAGAFGVPTVAMPTTEFARAITPGVDGFLAADSAEWTDALTAALDLDGGRRVGDAAHATVQRHHTFASQSGALARLLAPLAGRSTGPAPALEPFGPADHPWQRAQRLQVRWQLLRGPTDVPGQTTAGMLLEPLPDELATPFTTASSDGEPPAWFVGGDLRLTADQTLIATGPDPQLLSARFDLLLAGLRYLRIRLAARPREARPTLQLFWQRDDEDRFDETRSIGCTLAESEEPTTLVFDLHDGAWPRSGRLTRLRLDPFDCPGTLRVLEVALCAAPGADGVARATPLLDLTAIGETHAAPAVRRPVDVVIPVYNAREQTEACAESVLRHATGDWRLVLIDDCSPDPTIWPALQAIAARDPRVELRRNERNRGFTGTANRGLSEAGGRDVLLLNSDTLVTAHFLDGLHDCVYADDKTGIVSSLSNNATVCSVPEFCRPNPIPEGYTVDTFGELVRATSLRLRPELVTAVGFCMWVRAEVIERIGLLDEERFGRGYGEENDYCERALAAGYTLRLADDVFVFHEGEASFGADTQVLKSKNHDTLEALHPGFFAKVARFIEENPLRSVHQNLRLALQRRAGTDPALLILLHASFDEPAGGTEFHVRELVAAARWPRVVVAVPSGESIHVTEVLDGNLAEANQYRFPLVQPVDRFMLERAEITDTLATILRLFGVASVHVHHLLSWPLRVWRTIADAGLPFHVTLHDYFCVCPSLNLIDVDTEALCCASPEGPPVDPSHCLRALFHEMTLAPPADLPGFARQHREEFGQLLAAAQSIVVPSGAVRDLVQRAHALPPDTIQVVPHGYAPPARMAPRAPSGPRLRVGILGVISHPTKGPRHYRELLERTRALPIEWHVFGSTAHGGYDAVLQSLKLGDRLVLHGAYRRSQIIDDLRTHGIDLTMHLPAAPETFSFTLSESLLAGVPAIVNERGALPERIAASGAGVVVGSVAEAAATLERLLHDRGELAALQTRAAAFQHPSLDAMTAAYRTLHAERLAATGAVTPSSLVDRQLLFHAYHGSSFTNTPAATDDLSHYRRWWYPIYYRLAPLVPVQLRQWARARFAARTWQPVASFSFGGGDDARIVAGPSVALIDRRDQIATYRAADRDPFFLLGTGGPLPTRDVRVIRFRMRCRASGYVFAQLYWSHGTEEPFSEEKSVQVPLMATDDLWREYVVRIDETERSGVWDAGEAIHHLRFDPLNVAGTIELRDLFLCGPDASGASPGH